MKHFDNEKLRKLMCSVLSEKGMNSDSINHCVNSLMQTSIRGVDSHGINLFPHYSRAVDSGRINKNPQFKFMQSASGTAILDADHAFGHHSGAVAMLKAIKLAKTNGISAVSVINSSHFGAAAYFALIAAEQGMLGFSFTNADALVKATGAKKAFFGTNPICFTAPLKNEAPLCLDMATSLVSWNKIMNKRRTGETIPEHWAYNSEGVSTTNPEEARSLGPIGEYKGFGLGFMVDVLCAVLAGGLISKDILPMYNSPIEAQRRVGHFFMAIDIGKFSPMEDFIEYLQNTVDRIRSMDPLPGEVVMVPGDPEKKTERERLVSGIPVDNAKFEEFLVVDQSFFKLLKELKKVVDIVNLNADASCLSSERWLEILSGGQKSELYRLYEAYVTGKKKVTLGITGSTWSDINSFNPECIELFRSNPDTFEFIVRPYAHDIALLRSDEGFLKNLHMGIKILERLKIPYVNFYLPPEFMLTNTQVKLLQDSGISGTFINYARFKTELHDRIPKHPYILKGIIGSSLKCLPFESTLTTAYLNGLHHYNADQWNKTIINSDRDTIYSWRDGESGFFIPDGIEREVVWLNEENNKLQRTFLSEILDEINYGPYNAENSAQFLFYPTHSFLAWMKESKMIGFLHKLNEVEKHIEQLDIRKTALWLQIINSDIFSAIEKNSPVINISIDHKINSYTIWRSTRGVEGEEMLYHLNNDSSNFDNSSAFGKKIRERMHFLEELI